MATAGTPERWLALLPGVALGALAALMFHEWWLVGYLADPETLANYHFGSEAMVGIGGPHYRTAEIYASAALRDAGLLALGASASTARNCG